MKKIAFLFPGQGSQSIGMGQDLFLEYEEVRDIFAQAETLCGLPISKLCFEGPMEALTQTVNLQPAVTAVNLACLVALRKKGIQPDFCAGHSLGEYSALCAAGIVSAADTLKLVFRRGELMHRESLKNKGAMSAIIGLTIEQVTDLTDRGRSEGIVSVANHNSESQIVITGEPGPVKAVAAMAKDLGGKAVPLKVSGAWHSQLIRGAVEEFNRYLTETSFEDPSCGVVLNVTGSGSASAEEIKQIMFQQLTSPVKWYDAMQRLISEKVDTFVEVGPGKVLTGLIRKTAPKEYPCRIYNVGDLKGLDTLVSALKD